MQQTRPALALALGGNRVGQTSRQHIVQFGKVSNRHFKARAKVCYRGGRFYHVWLVFRAYDHFGSPADRGAGGGGGPLHGGHAEPLPRREAECLGLFASLGRKRLAEEKEVGIP